MEKTKICIFWKNKNCKFMEDASKCIYAHGEDDMFMVECKYGNGCYNNYCKFKHEDKFIIPEIPDRIYDFPIINKKEIKKIQKNKKLNYKKEKIYGSTKIESENENNINIINEEKIIPFKNNTPPRNTTVNIINKEKGIKENINVIKTDYNQMLSYIDDFYIKRYNTMVYSKNKHIGIIVENNYKNIIYLRNINNNKDLIINKLKYENNCLKKNIEKLQNDREKTNTINNKMDMVGMNKKRKPTKNKKLLISLYDKYINLYYVFNKYNNYKLIDIDEIRKYTKDNNIYKVKQRCYKIYNFYEKYKNGIIKDLLPISKIITMVF